MNAALRSWGQQKSNRKSPIGKRLGLLHLYLCDTAENGEKGIVRKVFQLDGCENLVMCTQDRLEVGLASILLRIWTWISYLKICVTCTYTTRDKKK